MFCLALGNLVDNCRLCYSYKGGGVKWVLKLMCQNKVVLAAWVCFEGDTEILDHVLLRIGFVLFIEKQYGRGPGYRESIKC